jgi:hypothetical protein
VATPGSLFLQGICNGGRILAVPDEPFGKGINDYYNHYILLTDGKAAAVFAVSVALIAVLVDPDGQPQTTVHGWCFHWAAVLAFATAIGFSAWTIIPRLPSGRRGLIFWEDVQTFPDYTEYQRAVAGLTSDQIEAEYAAQNFFVSRVVHRKMVAVRNAIVALLAGIGLSLIQWILR